MENEDFALDIGARISITDAIDGTFEGVLTKKVIDKTGNFTLTLGKCCRVGSAKILPGLQNFESTAIIGQVSQQHLKSIFLSLGD